ncbi:MAG: hypothetical protein PHE32_03590 [Candidatus Shapirobacteria bacterium]|nr:hypothetical protein [Candidatus Shapirobacteria bacterium]MDD4410757.1 hypothetical protein [Candidatus Shapirobacteria bacterium]
MATKRPNIVRNDYNMKEEKKNRCEEWGWVVLKSNKCFIFCFNTTRIIKFFQDQTEAFHKDGGIFELFCYSICYQQKISLLLPLTDLRLLM